MKEIRKSSYTEFETWFFSREARVKGTPLPETTDEKKARMIRLHGPLQGAFEKAVWSIVIIESLEELGRLVFLGSSWAEKLGLIKGGNRLLGAVVKNAKTENYYGLAEESNRDSLEYKKRRIYIGKYSNEWPVFKEDERIVIRSVTSGEQQSNPKAEYYIDDGNHRLLAYSYLITYEKKSFIQVEAFLAKGRF